MRSVAVSNSPVIGIIAESAPDVELHAGIVRRSGGSPRPILAGDSAKDAMEWVGGLIVAGEPTGRRAGRKPGTLAGGQTLELRLLAAALERDMPVLGTGRGMHAINAVVGGASPAALVGHGVEVEEGDQASSYHRIYIAPGSKLAAIVGSGGFVRVNSRHEHGIKEPQKSSRLLASAYSLEDGVIEALESPDHDWVIGVQFNPERRLEVPPHFDRLFQGLVERAQRKASRFPTSQDPSLRSG